LKLQEERYAEEQAKKREYLIKYSIAEENKRKREQELEEQRLKKIQIEQEKERQTRLVYDSSPLYENHRQSNNKKGREL